MGVINIDEIKQDMVLAEDLKGNNGRFLLAKGTVLTQKHLRVFKIWGVIEANIEGISKENVEKDREIQSLKSKLLSKKTRDVLSGAREIGGIKVIARKMEADSPKELRESADRIKDWLVSGIVLLGAEKEGKVMLTCVVTKDLMDRFKAGDIVRQLSNIVGGKGGGRPDMAQGGGSKPEELENAFEALFNLIGNGGI